jgi:LPS-assembly lipoprotein
MMQMPKGLQLIILLLATCLLSGCGFTLRGSEAASLPVQLQTLQLQFAGSNELGQVFQRELLAAGVELSENSTFRLELGNEQSQERVVSVNQNIRAGEYELSMSSSFRLYEDGELLMDSGPVSSFQIYEADPLNAAAKTIETELVKDELRLDLVMQMMRSLQSLTL